jgi:hypothetical protein
VVVVCVEGVREGGEKVFLPDVFGIVVVVQSRKRRMLKRKVCQPEVEAPA